MLVKSQVKYIQSLGHKKFRDAEGVFVAEGSKIVLELLSSAQIVPVALYATAEWLAENDSRGLRGQGLVEVDGRDMDRISFLNTPGVVLGLFRKPSFAGKKESRGIVLLLDEIQDPGNLGAIIRSADWFGIDNVICSSGTADAFNPKVVQSTMGSIARVEVSYGDLGEYLRRHAGIPSYAAVLDGRDLLQTQSVKEALILIGNESRGVHPELAALTTHRIRIPRRGAAESLNAAVAAGIILSMFQKV